MIGGGFMRQLFGKEAADLGISFDNEQAMGSLDAEAEADDVEVEEKENVRGDRGRPRKRKEFKEPLRPRKNPRQGLPYVCPFAANCSILNSRITEHVCRQHKDLIHRSEAEGGGSVATLVARIKAHSQAHFNRNQTRLYKECSDCGVNYYYTSLYRHRLEVHGVTAQLAKVERQESKLKKVTEADRASKLKKVPSDPMVAEFKDYVTEFSGGLLAVATANSKARDLQKMIDNAGLRPCSFGEVCALDIVAEENRMIVDKYLSSESKRIKQGFRTIVGALNDFNRFLRIRKQELICGTHLERSMKSFGTSVEAWQASTSKLKKQTNADNRVKLDKRYSEICDDGKIEELANVLQGLKIKAEEPFSSAQDRATYIQSMMCFGPGNANRPDVPTNFTISEFRDWMDDSATLPDAEVRVHKHKTADTYGPARVCVTSFKDMLITYGNEMLRKTGAQGHDGFFAMPNFTATWARVRRQCDLDINTSDYRKYIETQGKLHLSEDGQRSLANRLCHRPQVANQFYQATTHLMAVQGASLVNNMASATPASGVEEKTQSLEGAALVNDLSSSRVLFRRGNDDVKENTRVAPVLQSSDPRRKLVPTSRVLQSPVKHWKKNILDVTANVSSNDGELPRCGGKDVAAKKVVVKKRAAKTKKGAAKKKLQKVEESYCHACKAPFSTYQGADWLLCAQCVKWFCGVCNEESEGEPYLCKTCDVL